METQNIYSLEEMKSWLPELFSIMRRAGAAVMEVYAGNFTTTTKTDNSPVTQADIKSHEIISEELGKLTPDLLIISEEATELPFVKRKEQKYIWLVDPLDGTKEFVNRNDEFAICLALIESGIPILGVIYIPVTEVFYYALRDFGAFRLKPGGNIELLPLAKPKSREYVNILTSRSHCSEQDELFIRKFQERAKSAKTQAVGSALKFGLIAEGNADVYPKFGYTSEWDTAAGQVILEESGGKLVTAFGNEPLVYNKENLQNPFFIAWGSANKKHGRQ